MSAPTQITARRVVVVDCETTGLTLGAHEVVEIAWWDLHTGVRDCFVPPHDVHKALANADILALQINRYIDRLATAEQDRDYTQTRRLAEVLDGQTLAGSNPSFDAGFLEYLFRGLENQDLVAAPRWHHRLWDLSAYAAGVLGLGYLPGLSEVCELLGVESRPDHTAAGDVTATGECFLALFERAGAR